MLIRKTRAPRAVTIFQSQVLKRQLRQVLRSLPNNRQTNHNRVDAQERAYVLTKCEPDREASIRAVTNQIASQWRQAKFKTAADVHLTNEQRLTCKAVAVLPEQVNEAVNNLLLETLTASKKPVNNRLSAAFKTLVVHKVNEIVNFLSFVSWFLNAVIVYPKSVASLRKRATLKA